VAVHTTPEAVFLQQTIGIVLYCMLTKTLPDLIRMEVSVWYFLMYSLSHYGDFV